MNVLQKKQKTAKKAMEKPMTVTAVSTMSERMKEIIEGKMAVAMGKKVFLYVEQTDGGMDVHVVTYMHQLATLHGWMSTSSWMEDVTLVDWCMTAEIGDVHHHRLGIAIRVKDANV